MGLDLLVVGGGIVGAAVLREAAHRGLAATLVEAHDFGGGTTAKTSRLLHGGLRYLEHGDVALVRESLAERNAILSDAVPLAEAARFLVPSFRGRGKPAWMIRTGLAAYDLLGGRRLGAHRGVSLDEARARLPAAAAELRTAAEYSDALVRPERLTAETIRDAVVSPGDRAVAFSRARLVRLLHEKGRVAGGVVEVEGVRWDRTGARRANETVELRARAVLLSPGPWCDRLLAELGISIGPVLRTTRGTHALFPNVRLAGPVLTTARRDGRPLFLLPAPGGVFVGTTEADETRPPEEVVAEAWEIDYLREEAEALLGPVPDPDGVWTGLRPLVRDPTARAPGDVSRRDRIVAVPSTPGLHLLVGGKLTTHRAMARRALAKIFGPCRADLPALRIRGGRGPTETDAVEDLDLACDLAPTTLGDLVFRRTWFGLLPSTGPTQIADAASRVAHRLGWDAGRMDEEIRSACAEGAREYGRKRLQAAGRLA